MELSVVLRSGLVVIKSDCKDWLAEFNLLCDGFSVC